MGRPRTISAVFSDRRDTINTRRRWRSTVHARVSLAIDTPFASDPRLQAWETVAFFSVFVSALVSMSESSHGHSVAEII